MPSSQLGQLQLGQAQLGQVVDSAIGNIEPSSILTAEAFGTATVQGGGIIADSILTAEAFGTASVSATQLISPSSIETAEAFGTLSITQYVNPSSIATAETFGTLSLGFSISPSSILTGQSFGQPSIIIAGNGALGFQLFINSVDRTSYLRLDTLNFVMELSSNWQGSFTVKDTANLYRPSNGQRFEFWWKGTLLFAGLLQGYRENMPSGTSLCLIDLNLMDWSAILVRRIVKRAYNYEDGFTTLNLILQDILANSLDQEGLSLGTISTAVSMAVTDAFDFNLKTVQQCFNELSDFFAVDWKVDQYRVISFQTFAAVAAPYAVADGDGNVKADSVSVTRSLANYGNQFYTRSDSGASAVKAETFVGDGTTRSFTVSQPVANSTDGEANPRVFVGGLEYICIRRSEINSFNPARASISPYTGPEWFSWDDDNTPSPGGIHPARIITGWAFAGSPPGIGILVQIDYPVGAGGGDFISDSAEIAARQAIEGGSGLYEVVADYASIAPGGAGSQIAAGLKDRYGREEVTINFRTLRDGLYPGQTLNVGLTKPLCTGPLLIERVEVREENALMAVGGQWRANNQDGPFLLYDVTATSSRARRNSDAHRWEDVNAKLIRVSRNPEIFSWNLNDTLVVGAIAEILVARQDGALTESSLIFAASPVGASIVVDVKKNGATIFTAVAGKLVFPAGATEAVWQAVFTTVPLKYKRGDQFTLNVDQVGSVTAGATGTLVLYSA